jgi:hypothetical protein
MYAHAHAHVQEKSFFIPPVFFTAGIETLPPTTYHLLALLARLDRFT